MKAQSCEPAEHISTKRQETAPNALSGSDEFDSKIATDSAGRSAQGLQGDGGISGRQESVQRRAASLYPAGHLHFADIPGLHCFLHLEGNGLFDGNRTRFFKKALLAQEVVKR